MTLTIDLQTMPPSVREFIQNGRWDEAEIVITDNDRPVAAVRPAMREPWRSMLKLAQEQPMRGVTMEDIQAWKEEGRA